MTLGESPLCRTRLSLERRKRQGRRCTCLDRQREMVRSLVCEIPATFEDTPQATETRPLSPSPCSSPQWSSVRPRLLARRTMPLPLQPLRPFVRSPARRFFQNTNFASSASTSPRSRRLPLTHLPSLFTHSLSVSPPSSSPPPRLFPASFPRSLSDYFLLSFRAIQRGNQADFGDSLRISAEVFPFVRKAPARPRPLRVAGFHNKTPPRAPPRRAYTFAAFRLGKQRRAEEARRAAAARWIESARARLRSSTGRRRIDE